MADNRTKEQRSYNMSQIRSKDTKPEILVRKFLFSNGFRYRLHVQTLPGKPDIVLPKYKTIIFIHGCFWHGHRNCRNAKTPQSNRDFWLNKILTNAERDKKNTTLLRRLGWKILVLWECQLMSLKVNAILSNLVKKLEPSI